VNDKEHIRDQVEYQPLQRPRLRCDMLLPRRTTQTRPRPTHCRRRRFSMLSEVVVEAVDVEAAAQAAMTLPRAVAQQ
jgi:hypothetical protein